MTIQNIIDGIAEALFQEFGSNYEIYTTKVEQGLNEPCFLVRCLNPTKNRSIGVRHLRTNQFAVQYFPADHSDPVGECYFALERLFDCLRDVVVLGKPVHGADLNGEIVDGVLTFTVNYDAFVFEQIESEPVMNTVNTWTEAKGTN